MTAASYGLGNRAAVAAPLSASPTSCHQGCDRRHLSSEDLGKSGWPCDVGQTSWRQSTRSRVSVWEGPAQPSIITMNINRGMYIGQPRQGQPNVQTFSAKLGHR